MHGPNSLHARIHGQSSPQRPEAVSQSKLFLNTLARTASSRTAAGTQGTAAGGLAANQLSRSLWLEAATASWATFERLAFITARTTAAGVARCRDGKCFRKTQSVPRTCKVGMAGCNMAGTEESTAARTPLVWPALLRGPVILRGLAASESLRNFLFDPVSTEVRNSSGQWLAKAVARPIHIAASSRQAP